MPNASIEDLLVKVIYPDGDGGQDNVRYTYYNDGSTKTFTDQRGVVHTYTYDDMGRKTSDAAGGSPVGGEGAVRRRKNPNTVTISTARSDTKSRNSAAIQFMPSNSSVAARGAEPP